MNYLINITPCDWNLLRRFAIPRWESEGGQIPMEIHGEIEAAPRLQALTNIGQALGQKYHAVVTNPPYMGSSGMGPKLSDYVKKNYPDSKSDLFACFIERGNKFASKCGYNAMVTMQSWMFLSSFERLRHSLIHSHELVSLMHMENMVMGIAFGTAVSVFQNTHVNGFKGTYCHIKLGDIVNDAPIKFPIPGNRFAQVCSENYSMIPGMPIAYWASDTMMHLFSTQKKIRDYAEPRHGMSTGNNDLCLKLWFEVQTDKIYFEAKNLTEFDASNRKFAPYKKGGDYRRWYGNNDYIIAYDQKSRSVMEKLSGYRSSSTGFFFRESINWSDVSNGAFSARLSPCGFAFDGRGASMFCSNEMRYYIAGIMTSKIAAYVLGILNPTITFNIDNIASIPVIYDADKKDEVDNLVYTCIELSKADWDAFEISWDFKEHPFITATKIDSPQGKANTVKGAFAVWESIAKKRFDTTKKCEERLNKIFIDMYGLSEELAPEVEEKDVSIRKADLRRDVRSFISYAVGCMLGRYSLDEPGLVYAGGIRDASKYQTFIPDADAILPICDDEYFEDDIVGRFVKFVETVYGKETLEENLCFISDALGGKGSSREVIRNYFINDFYADHLKVYQKRPIYWLFDSGKKNGFKCLIYMHRYQPDTIARIRTDYVHEQQSRYRTAIADLESRIANAGTGERVKLSKQLTKLQEQAEELRIYEEKVHHLADQMIRIDLDDGVKHNYAIFQDVLAKIK